MPEKKRVYITVKTYPTISKEYSELVCTAGLLEDGSWIRLYPVPFRLLKSEQKYPKYTWLEVEVEKKTTDFRFESYKPILNTITVEPKPQKADWDNRRKIILQNGTVYTNMQTIVKLAHSPEKVSLATFKPTKIIDFIVEKDSHPEWDAGKLSSLWMKSHQLSVFQTEEEVKAEFEIVQKIPYRFYYKFEDDSGKKSRLMIEDWEIGMLYLNCLKAAQGNEAIAIDKVRKRYFDSFLKRDIYFFLGTTLKYHSARQPYIIIGVFYPPILPDNEQLSLF